MSRGFFITGTDTGVGKTHATCAMLHALKQRGLHAAPMKPVAAGTDETGMNEDVAAMLAVTGHQFAAADVNPYCLKAPLAPHIAAQMENVDIEMARIASAYARLAAQADVVLVEGAGGFLVPMNDAASMADIPRELGLGVILVVSMRLGCLNHALLTAEVVRARGLTLSGWIANTPGETMAAFEDNLATLKVAMAAPLLGTLPYLERSQASNTMTRAARAAAHLDLDPLF